VFQTDLPEREDGFYGQIEKIDEEGGSPVNP
jgi:hypothetical protein